MEWRHRDIITNGIRMHYVTEGEGPLVVLLHGFPEFWYSWRYQIPMLAALGNMVVAPDLRGYNDSDKPRNSEGYRVSNLLRDIEGLIHGLGREKAIVIGHDWGGALAWAFASRYPQMIERLIVLNAPHPGAMMRALRTAEQRRKSWYMFFFQIPWLPEQILLRNHAAAIARTLRSSAVQKTAFPDDVLAAYRDAMNKPGVMTAALNYYRQLLRNPSRSASAEQVHISVPTLLIWGEQDVALGIELTEGLEHWVDNLQVKRIPDSGHWVQQEKPDLVNEYIREFLKPQS
jgi:pimeloyl-ACP methyl ester carboxylesterase